jgi:hypothetical protein
MTINVPVKFTASYQMFGDPEGYPWMKEILTQAVEAGTLEGANVLVAEPGIWGIQYILFQADMLIPGDATHADAEALALPVLNELIGDSDVEILWVSNAKSEESLNVG